jgi:hypothetical protein
MSKIINACAYLRKSTAEEGFEVSLEDQRKRISELRPAEPGATYRILRWYEEKPGTPGTVPLEKRREGGRMLRELQERKDVAAVLVDNADRLNRGEGFRTLHEDFLLKEAGIRWYHKVSGGVIDLLGDAAAIQRAADAMAAHAYVRNLSFRETHAGKRNAEKGLRAGGRIPFGMEPVLIANHKGEMRKLKMRPHPEHGKLVLWMFSEYDQGRSMNSIARELNQRKVPCPTRRAKMWYAVTIAGILRQRALRGDLVYNKEPQSGLHRIDGEGQVQDVRGRKLDRKHLDGARSKEIIKADVCEAVVPADLFARVQARLALAGKDRTRRKRSGEYCLTSIIRCSHCIREGRSGAMCGTRSDGAGSPIVYRCKAAEAGGACGMRQIRQDEILPAIMTWLGQDIRDLGQIAAPAPRPRRESRQQEQTQKLLAQRSELEQKVALVRKNFALAPDQETRDACIELLAELAEELAALGNPAETEEASYTEADIQALLSDWQSFERRAVRVPVPMELQLAYLKAAGWELEGQDDLARWNHVTRNGAAAPAFDGRLVKEYLQTRGFRAQVTWETRPWGTRQRHEVVDVSYKFEPDPSLYDQQRSASEA